ncbi:hypothetical protein [uncultured Lamprocystis sp.]|jgi:predicted transcriptional regulator|uniref:HVO_A0114 family putative DNA-binding protein n=1 Tax=uncultured Lamprocystis sp. TaxID=543132 RepID=UPI0025CD9112|nr:hypothetical protein [uncultured Lamprocystis sp.]
MNRIEISVMQPAAALRAFAETWHRAEAGQAIAPRVTFGSLHELFTTITEARMDLMRCLAAHPGLAALQLAKRLDRDPLEVQTDVAALVELGLLALDDNGALSAPYDEVLIHAAIRDAA